MFLNIHFLSKFALLYQNVHIKCIDSCFSPTIFEFSQTCSEVSKSINASLSQTEPTTSSSKKKNLPSMTLNSPARHLVSSVLSNFPSAIARTVMNAEMERWQCRTWLIAWWRENLQKIASWELILYHSLLLLSHECCCDSFSTLWNLLVFVTCSQPDINWLCSPTCIFSIEFLF